VVGVFGTVVGVVVGIISAELTSTRLSASVDEPN